MRDQIGIHEHGRGLEKGQSCSVVDDYSAYRESRTLHEYMLELNTLTPPFVTCHDCERELIMFCSVGELQYKPSSEAILNEMNEANAKAKEKKIP